MENAEQLVLNHLAMNYYYYYYYFIRGRVSEHVEGPHEPELVRFTRCSRARL